MSDPSSKAHLWSAGGHSVTGASHVRHNIPNQDAITWRPRGSAAPTAVLALSDGHGAKAHFRSGAGAHIAVDVAASVLAEALEDPAWIVAGDGEVARRLIRDIIGRWQSGVISDLAERPLPPQEAVSFERRFIPYGATLIAAAVCPQGAFVLQIGDGDMLLGTADGVVFRPLAEDEGLIGEQTYSLCLPDAEERARYSVMPARAETIDFVMLSTDGLAKSFANNQAFVRHAASWRMLIAGAGLDAVAEKLERWLVGATRYGNGDDMTLGFLIRDRANAMPSIADFATLTQDEKQMKAPGEAVGLGLTGFGFVAVAAIGFLLARWIW